MIRLVGQAACMGKNGANIPNFSPKIVKEEIT